MALKPIELIIRAKDEASGVFDGLKGKLGSIGAAIAGYFGIKAFAGAVQGAADLEAKLSEVQAVSGATADEMVRLRQAAEEAGANTQYTATQAADALGNLTRAGLNANQAIQALPATLQLAQAGGIELGQASEYLTKSIMGMGDQFDQAGRYADVLTMGANASNTSVAGLAQALSYAAPTAHSLGLSLESTVAIIGKFADAGIDASRAGTALNSILAQFSDPASTFKKALSDIGITTTDFNAALTQLAAAGPKGQKAIAAVGLEAGPALKALLGQGIGALDDLRTKLQNAQGSAAATAATMSDNLNGAVKGLGSAWDTLKNAMATPVLPVLQAGVESLAASFRDAVDSGVVAKFGAAIATGFESAITWAKAFANEVDFAALGEQMRGYATQAGEAFNTIKNAATTAGDVVRLVWGTMSAGTNAVLSAVYGVGAAFSGMLSGIQSGLALTMDGFAKVTFGNVSASFKLAADSIRESAGATSAAADALGTKAAAALQRMADGAQTARTGWAGLTTDSTTTANTMAGTVSPALAQTAEQLQVVGEKSREAGNAAKLAAFAHAEAAAVQADAAKKVAAAAKQAADEQAKAAKAAADAAAAITAAFAAMGIKTKDELQKLADTAKTRFDLIKNSGQATADGLATAWKAMAEAAIAANGGVATETQKVQASMYGLRIETDATGKSIVTAMNAGGSATQAFTGTVNDARTAMERLNAERERGIAAQEKANELKAREKALEDAHYNRDAEGFGLNTAGERAVGGGMSLNAAVKQAVSQGLTEAQATKIAQDNYTAPRTVRMAGANFDIPGAVNQSNFNQAVTNALDAEITRKAMYPGLTGNNSAGTTTATTPAKTYNVTINGTTVRTASDADAQTLLRVLQNAKLSA